MSNPTMALPREDVSTRVNVTLGMVFFIGSWSMAFGTLFLSFLVLRQRIQVWPPADVALPSTSIAALGVLVLVASSAALHRAVTRMRERGAGYLSAWCAGLVLGLVFAGLQTWLWYDLMAAGRTQSSGLYETLFYGLTWIHAAHVLAGLLTLLWALVGLVRGRYGPHRFSSVSNAAIFWHFVGVVWLVLFLGFFVF